MKHIARPHVQSVDKQTAGFERCVSLPEKMHVYSLAPGSRASLSAGFSVHIVQIFSTGVPVISLHILKAKENKRIPLTDDEKKAFIVST
jgi:hypothetical protein